MNKKKTTEAGIDVSKDTLDCEALRDGKLVDTATFENNAAGHKKLIKWLTKSGRTAKVVLEATGTYSLDLSLALHRAKKIEVMVANPRAVKNFAGATMQRSKTDATDASALREFCQRMKFVPWVPPAPHLLEVREISRRMGALVVEVTREKNRLHALETSNEHSRFVANDIEVNIRHLERRIELLESQAVARICDYEDLKNAFDRITSIPGIATRSAVTLLPELLVLPADMTVRQWVAHAGLDPRAYQSGTSVHRPARISKRGNVRIRRGLFMPALVANQHDPNVQAFFNKLIARGKTKMQATTAVMRKLLHAIYGVLRNDQNFVGEKFCLAA